MTTRCVSHALLLELVQAMAAKRGHSGKVTVYPWKRALQLAQKPGDERPRLIIPLNRSPERESLYAWVVPLVVDETAIVTRHKVDRPSGELSTEAQ